MVKNLPYNPGETSLINGGGTNIPHATGQLSPSTNYWACALWSLHTQLESPVCCKERPHVLPLRPTAAECLECTGSLWILHTQLMVQKNSTFSKEWGGFGSWKNGNLSSESTLTNIRSNRKGCFVWQLYLAIPAELWEDREWAQRARYASHHCITWLLWCENMPYDWGQFPLELWN